MGEDISSIEGASLRPVRVRKWFGGTAALLGAIWAGVYIVPPVREILAGSGGFLDLTFLAVMGLAMATPGLLVMSSGIRLFFEMRESALKLIVGFYAVLLCVMIPSFLATALPDVLPERLEISGYMLTGSGAAAAAYVFSIRMLLTYFTGIAPIWRSLFSRGVLLLMGWQVWLFTSNLFDSYRPAISESTQRPEWQLSILSVLIPVVLAYGSYRLLCALLLPRRAR